jgi:hypothetical protein
LPSANACRRAEPSGRELADAERSQRGEQPDRLEHVRLTGAVVAGEHREARPELDDRVLEVAEVVQLEPAQQDR